MSDQQFVRYQSAVVNRHGRFPGVFALANGLAHDGHLTPDDYAWWRRANDEANRLYRDPSTVDPTCYDREQNPGAVAWFRASSVHLLVMTRPYLDLLDRYAVPWIRITTSDPGRIVYEDDVQVVAIPQDLAVTPRSDPSA